jgi:predicted AAA+ superfamily ATPase
VTAPLPHDLSAVLDRIAVALERLAPAAPADAPLLGEADAYHWDAASGTLMPVERVARVPLSLLRGVDQVKTILLANTEQFARGHGANNALLWGARGMGKSSLVKAIHADIAARRDEASGG